jgi:hypothetical protein
LRQSCSAANLRVARGAADFISANIIAAIFEVNLAKAAAWFSHSAKLETQTVSATG